MCDPVSMGIMMAASTGLGIMEQRGQQKYAEGVAQTNADQANKAATENFLVQNRQLNQMELQDNMNANIEKAQMALGAQKAVATQRVSSGSAGVSGLSIDSLFADIDRQAGNNMTTIDRNLESATDQRNFERKVVRNNTNASFVNRSVYKSKMGGLGSALQIASAGAGGYMQAGGKF